MTRETIWVVISVTCAQRRGLLTIVIMKSSNSQTVRIAAAAVVVVGAILYLAFTGVESGKSYYVTIQQLQAMGSKAYTQHLRVAGTVEPGSIRRNGPHAEFVLLENTRKLTVDYTGQDPPPDTFKNNSMALAIGMYGRDGVFHATGLQSKCASKYAPKVVKTSTSSATQTAAVTPPVTTGKVR